MQSFATRHSPLATTPRPFLKWAGGKRWLVPRIVEALPENSKRFVEPMIGGGAVFFAVRAARPNVKFLIADANADLIAAYQTVKKQPARLIKLLAAHREKHDEKYFYQKRAGWSEQMSAIKRAALLIYLNRTCYNGLFRVNSRGEFNVPFGRYKNPRILDEPNLRAVSRALQGVKIELADFEKTLGKCGAGDFVYVDPPYAPLSKSANFTSYSRAGFSDDDQRKLVACLIAAVRRGAWAAYSNHDLPWLRELLQEQSPKPKIESVQVRRVINSKVSGRGPTAELIAWWLPATGPVRKAPLPRPLPSKAGEG